MASPTIFSRLIARLQLSVAKAGINALRLSGAYAGYWEHWRGPLFEYAETRGIHILPVHYYSPIPPTPDVVRHAHQKSRSTFDVDVAGGALKASALIEKYDSDLMGLFSGTSGYSADNSSFHPLDAAITYAYVREAKPKRIIEIGSGMSTLAILAAINDDADLSDTHLTCVEPYLPSYLQTNRDKITEIIEQPVQDVPLQKFQSLARNDILFIDSTHVVRFGSDVVYEILEILPKLQSGVIVHVHDIFFPEDYPIEWLEHSKFFWNEQYLLQAFLSMNPNFQIEIPAYAIRNSLNLKSWPQSSVKPASLWMKRV